MTEEYVLVRRKRGGGIGELIVIICVMPFAVAMSIYDSFRASHIASRVEHGKFDVILLKEADRNAEKKILDKCNGLWDEKKPEFGNCWYRVDQSKYQGSPKPAWICRSVSEYGNYDEAYYGIFVGSNTIQQLRDWLKTNGYYKDTAYGGDGELVDTHASYRPNDIFTHDASGDVRTTQFGDYWRNNGERVSLEVQGIIETAWGIWNWNGEHVRDVSRNSDDEQDGFRAMSGNIRDALLPVHQNLYRRTGIRWVLATIWHLVYLFFAVIANVVPFIAAINVWATPSGARPPIPLLIFRYFGWIFSILFIPLSICMGDMWSAKWAALAWVAFTTLFGWIAQAILMNLYAQDELAVLRQYGRRSYWDEWDWPIHTATQAERWSGVSESA